MSAVQRASSAAGDDDLERLETNWVTMTVVPLAIGRKLTAAELEEEMNMEQVEYKVADWVHEERARWAREALAEGLEKGRKEGLEKGREEGLEKGREEAIQGTRELLLEQAKLKFEIRQESQLSELLKRMQSDRHLTSVGKQLMQAETLEELINRINGVN